MDLEKGPNWAINRTNNNNIYNYKYIKEFLKCIINILLKYTGTVFYTK